MVSKILEYSKEAAYFFFRLVLVYIEAAFLAEGKEKTSNTTSQ